jgi:hypothetical protein
MTVPSNTKGAQPHGASDISILAYSENVNAYHMKYYSREVVSPKYIYRLGDMY